MGVWFHSALLIFTMALLLIATVILVLYILDEAIRSLKVGGFSRKYVFITGCDSGFGQKLALRLDGLGFPVFAACLTEEGQKFLSENTSTQLVTLSLDVTDSDSIQKAFEFVQSKLPLGAGLWAIVNNAGVGGPGVPTEMTPREDFYKACEINVLGPVEICRRFLPLVRRMKGRVVNMVSVAGRIAVLTPAYNTSKFAMEGFSDTLRRELYDQGVKVSIIEPGLFKTNIIDQENLVKNLTHYYNQASEEVKATYGGEKFMKKSLKIGDNIQAIANPNLDLVVDAYVHAIVSRYPRTRYVVGWDAKLFYVPLSWLPSSVADWFIIKMMAKHSKEE